MLKFIVGLTSESNAGFLTEVNVAGLGTIEGFWALALGRTREISHARAARIAEALSSIEEAEALLSVANPSAEDVEHFEVWKEALLRRRGA